MVLPAWVLPWLQPLKIAINQEVFLASTLVCFFHRGNSGHIPELLPFSPCRRIHEVTVLTFLVALGIMAES